MARQRRIIVLVGLAAVAGAAVLTVKLRALRSVTLVPAKLTILAVEQNSADEPSSIRGAILRAATWPIPPKPVPQSLPNPASRRIPSPSTTVVTTARTSGSLAA